MKIEILEEEEVDELETEVFVPPRKSVITGHIQYLVPKKPERIAAGIVMYHTGLTALESQYMVLAVVPGWLVFCDQEGIQGKFIFEEIRRISPVDLGSMTMMVPEPGTDRMKSRTRHNVKGVLLEVVGEDGFHKEVRFGTRKAHQAQQWFNILNQAREVFEDEEGDVTDIVV